MQTNPFRHCPGCGLPGIAWTEDKRAECPACGYTIYMNAATACAAIITRGGLMLFAVRGRDPGKGMLDLPGGFVDPGESVESALIRELEEELGLKLPPGELRYRFSFANLYRYRDISYDTCDLFFQLELPAGLQPVAADDVADLVWLDPATVDPERLAFASMRAALGRFNTTSEGVF